MSLIFGVIVGFSLGLTGGGGSIFAVPLLVYGLAVPVHQAVVISLAAVGSTALLGALMQLHSGTAEFRTGIIFGLAGIMGTPLGTWLGGKLPATFLLGGCALLMLLIAFRLWRRASQNPAEARVVRAGIDPLDAAGPACRRDPDSQLHFTSRCAVMLVLTGIITGLLSGLFGVGGGFLIVPALLMIAALPIQRAVATSLVVITLISAAGVISQLLAGRALDLNLTAWFVLGGLAGMGLGILLSRWLAGPLLQKLFAGMMVAVAVYILIRDCYLT
jgi:hypothetical protein